MSYASYEAALRDLSADAVAWDDLAEAFSAVNTILEGCGLARREMDGVGHMVGAEGNYNSALRTFSDLAAAAPATFTTIAQKLRDTKRTYENADGYAQWMLDQG
ncbi:hypothetical protein ET445_05520 [Agromyces protaetiae]|uniref:ESX-1 secretion-associated protein n=1 Tax=Agromyces protaetiae TaxID=2509455 RepID=A0A4P6F9N0_9MICO|nr:hypothetical protein [Agromyces protaetiae]QAY72880.1 hypothetical protein ET445_05520 [Agromyces protaetiae]